MGQYYLACLFDTNSLSKMMVFDPTDFESGNKLMESAWIANSFVNAALSNLKDSPHKVAWIGDYSSDVLFSDEAGGPDTSSGCYTEKFKKSEFSAIYDKAWGEGKKRAVVKGTGLPGYEKLLTEDSPKGYLINHTQKVFIDMERYIKENTPTSGPDEGYCVHPLPILTACGNGMGGGDYSQDVGEFSVGSWAFDTLEYSDKKPNGYEEESLFFSDT